MDLMNVSYIYLPVFSDIGDMQLLLFQGKKYQILLITHVINDIALFTGQ